MAKISSYRIDRVVSGNDSWIGSDASSNGATRNFTPDDLSLYYIKNGYVDPGRYSLNYIYQIPNRDNKGVFNFETNNTRSVNIDTLTRIRISKLDNNRVDQSILINYLTGSDIKIITPERSKEANYGIFNITSVTEDGANYFFLDITRNSSTTGASITPGDVVSIVPMGGSGSGGGTAVNAFSSVAVPGQDTLVADRNTDTLTITQGAGILLTTVGSTDTLTISSVEHPHTNTFNGTIANRTLIATGVEQSINDITISHSTGFTYTLNSVKVPSGWTATVNTAADPDNFDLIIPATATAGTYLVEVNYTSIETSSSTMHTDVIDFNVILTTPPTPYYVQSSAGNITGSQTLTSSPWVEVNSNVRTGTALVFTRPTGHTGTYYGGVGIRTTGDGSVTIDTEASFDEGTSIPDVITTGITPSGYTVYVFPLHLPRTTITITTF